MARSIRIGILVSTLLLSAAPANAASKEQIQRSVERGVAFLKSMQREDGSWPTNRVGATALAGLALLECDLSESDPALKKAADYVRKTTLYFSEIHSTYSLSLAILFLDRLGDPADAPLIQALAVRVLSGQNAVGGWTYRCPAFDTDEAALLKMLTERRAELVSRPAPPRARGAQPRARPELPKEIQQMLAQLDQRGPAQPQGVETLLGGAGDNSNTQFAVLALWAARRQGIPVEKALALTEARFRRTQNADGGWGYHPGAAILRTAEISTPSMTCAGLLGLALGFGSAHEARLQAPGSPKNERPGPAHPSPDIGKDPAVRGGFRALAQVMGRALTPAEFQGLVVEGEVIRTINHAREYYFLWSLERVATLYGLNTIGNRDWYAWGAGTILATQKPDGGWTGKYGADVDTCFALLFLRRANLLSDLTAQLKGLVQDPGQAMLKSGGVTSEPPAKGKSSAAQPDHSDTKPTRARSRTDERKAPPAEPASPAAPTEAGELARELVESSGARQQKLLAQLRDGKGVVHTDALAAAIRQLSGATRTKAREALAERLARMTPATLRDKLKDEDAEIRRAAALACTVKAEGQFVPDLIPLLGDPEPTVARAAYAALKDLTGQSFAAEDADKWQAWWKKQAGK